MQTQVNFSYFYGEESEQFSYFRIPRLLVRSKKFKTLSTDAKLLYGLMLDRMGLSAKHGWYDELGRVYIYYTLDEIQTDLMCGHNKAVRLLAELDTGKDGFGLIERMKQGQGRPAKIYVKKFTTTDVPEAPLSAPISDFPDSEIQTSQNQTSRLPLLGSQDFPKREASYLDNIYPEFSYSYGSWTKADDVQHKRTKTCSACKTSSEEYADHVDTDGDGKCDTCGVAVSLTVTWDAGSNGGTIDGKASFSETVKPNSKPTAPGSFPVKTGYTFKGWFTSKTGGSLYSTVTITSSTTFYAQFEANKYTVTWDLGTGKTETTNQTYGEKLALPTEPTRKNAEFLGWFTEADGGTEVTATDVFTDTIDKTYYAHWEITEVFSVTVPVVLPLTVDENGEVHTGSAEIINASTGAVVVSSVSISTKNGWQLVPYTTDMAHAKVDAKQLGFKINDSLTTKTGDAETFSLTSPWTIAENGKLPLSYDAVVSAVSQPVTEQDVLSVVFVLEWGGE